MSLELIPSTRGTKVLVHTKHIKTIPQKYATVYTKVHPKMNLEKRRLSPYERNLLEIQFHYKNWLNKLSSDNRHLFDLIKNATPVASRLVKTPHIERMEIILNNDIKINTTSLKFFNLFPHTSTAYLNY
jgi:hypothetical protein